MRQQVVEILPLPVLAKETLEALPVQQLMLLSSVGNTGAHTNSDHFLMAMSTFICMETPHLPRNLEIQLIVSGASAAITDCQQKQQVDLSITFAGGTLYIQDATTGVKIDTSTGNGAVTIASADGDHDESLTITTAGSGAVAVGRIGGYLIKETASGDGIKTVAINGSSTGITLSGDITTAYCCKYYHLHRSGSDFRRR